MKSYIYIPHSLCAAGKHLRHAFDHSLEVLPKREFIRAWCAIAYLYPGLLSLVGRFDRRAYTDRAWLGPNGQQAFDRDPVLAAGGRPTSIREMSVAQLTATNLPMLLRWEDRNSMAFSVEARVPFLDYRVVEHCLNMADGDKVGQGISKRVLRRITSRR